MELVGIVWDAATCLFSCCKVRAAYVYKLDENLVLLQRKCVELQSKSKDLLKRIEDAEGNINEKMQRTNEVKDWLQQVQNLDKVMTDIQQDRNAQQAHHNWFSLPKKCLSSYKLGKKIVKKMLPDVDDLLTRGLHFDDVDIAFKLPPNPIDEMPSVETVGLDSMLNEIWNTIEDENIGIIGLYGMGGVGKTTLLKRIHNELGKRKHDFAVVLWVVVSRDYDLNRIMNDIRNRIGISDGIWNNSSQDQRVAKIYQALKQKKFVLMLDDVWEKLDLRAVGVPLPKETNNQSKVFFTTRSEDVCAKMQAEKKFEVKCLSEKEAFDLFCKNVGEETLKNRREILKEARKMTKECGGLPLALITVGSAMAGVNSIDAWRQASTDLRSSDWIASDMENKVFRILKFSYDRLPNETHKRCFLYCALYPEDYEIEVDGLIDRWIGEGFLDENKSVYDMYAQGKSIIERLRLSSLLEDADERLFSAIKMHDVIRDMALWLSRDQDKNKDKVLVEGEALVTAKMNPERLNVVETISIVKAKGMQQIPACPNLNTLCLQPKEDINDYSNLQSMTRLKVLDLSGGNYYEPPHFPLLQISKLINLEFLNLSGTRIPDKLSIELTNLKKLRILLLEYTADCDLFLIPLEVIESLEQLKVFRFNPTTWMAEAHYSQSHVEEAFLEKLESLPKLEELCFQVTTIMGMHKLLNSTKLQSCLRHFYIGRIQDPLELPLLLSSLSGMKHLEGMSLSHVKSIIEGSFNITYRGHLQNIRLVEISYCDSITHLTWLQYAPLLESLVIQSCESIEEVVKLQVEDEEGGPDRVRDDASDIFPNLKRLILESLPKLKGIYKRALAFPHLELIYVVDCPDLRKLPLNSSSAKDSLIQISGGTKWWNNLEWEDTDTSIQDFHRSKFQSF